MRSFLIGVFSLLLMAGSASAKLSPEYSDWAKGPVKHLMTEADLKAWKAVKTDEEAKAFIDLFWARRDPTPATPENEWRAEFDVRVALADQHFSRTKEKGSLTDRGKILILLGSPSEVGSKGGAKRSENAAPSNPGDPFSGEVNIPSVTAEPARQTWTYAGDRMPSFIEGKMLELLFIDDAGRNDWQLAKHERVTPALVIEQAVNALIFSPDMTAVPDYSAVAAAPAKPTSFEDPALQAAWQQFRTGEMQGAGSARLTWGEYVTAEGDSFAAVQLYFPAGSGFDAGRNVTFIGVIEDEAGQIVDLRSRQTTLTASVRDAFVDDSFVLAPGRYKGTFGIAENGKFLAMTTTELAIEGLDPAITGISQLILSNHAYPIPEGQLATDPYAFGGLKFVPKGDAAFVTSDDLWYFFELRNPGEAETGAPKMNVKVNFDGKAAGSDQPVKFELPFREVEAIPLKGLEHRYGLGMSFPLKSFKPGQYTMKIRVIDTVLRKSYDFEREIEVR